MLCYVVRLCYVMLCYVMLLSYVMLCYVNAMLCYVSALYNVNFIINILRIKLILKDVNIKTKS
jgi:hypothetical protein